MANSTQADRKPASLVRQVYNVAGKDLRLELRTKESLNVSISFALLTLVLFSFAFDPTEETTRQLAGGLLWLVFLFAGSLILNRSFARETPNDCLDVLLASPMPPSALYLGKVFANFVLLLVVEAIALPVFGLFYNVRWYEQWPMIVVVFLLATWGIAVVSTAFSALTVNLRLREVMLPVLVYPLVVPALMGAIMLSAPLATGQPLTTDLYPYLRLLIAFDIIFTLLSVSLIDAILIG